MRRVPSEILDQFVRLGPEELDAAVRRFKKAMIERALGGELTHHMGYPPGGVKPWTHVIAFFAFPPEARRVVYTTNAPFYPSPCVATWGT